MNIENIRTYISLCPYLDNSTAINIDYLSDNIKSYSITESSSYNPIISTDIIGNEQKQFLFNFDAKLNWTDEIANNISNSNFFSNFSSWLKNNNENKIFPQHSENITIETIGATSNGYIFATESNEAIYRISCEIKYMQIKTDINNNVSL